MQPSIFHLDLRCYRLSESKVFTTQARGKEVRFHSSIDLIEPQFDKVVVSVPKEICSTNPSFLKGLLANVVVRLGEQRFLKKILV